MDLSTLFNRYCKDTETLEEEDFDGYEAGEEHMQKQGGGQMPEQAFEGRRGHMLKHLTRVGAVPHPQASSPLRAKGCGEMTRRGRVLEGRIRPEEKSACRERSYSVNEQTWKASARCYAPEYPRRQEIRGRGRGRVSGSYQRQLPPRLLRQSRYEELIGEPLEFPNVEAPQVANYSFR